MLGTADDVVSGVAFALKQQVRFADGVGFGVDLLAEKVHRDLFATFVRQLQEGFLGHREHPASAASAVVKKVGAVGNLVGYGFEDQPGHEPDGIARRPVLASFFVVFLVEAAHQFFEDGAHRVVVEARQAHAAVAVDDGIRAQVDRRVEELFD